MALLTAISVVPAFSVSADTQAETDTVTYATIDEFLCEIKNGQVTITGYIGNAEKLTVPSQMGEYTVRVIADNAFKGNTTLKNLTIGYEITKIGESAFENCTNLNIININGTPIIGMNAFYNTGYYNNDSKWSAGLLIANYYRDTILAAKKDIEGVVYLPETIVNIAAGAFENCDKLTAVYIFDEAFCNIGDRAFADCDSLLGVKIPDMIDYMGNDIFAGSEKAEAYCVDNNAYVESKCKKENVPFNMIGMYSTYDEEWDLTLTSYDDVWFTVEEVVYSEEVANEISTNLSGAKLGKAYKLDTYCPYISPQSSDFSNLKLTAPVEGDALVDIYRNNGYKANPYYFSSFENGYAEFRYYSGDVVTNMEFAYYSTTDEAKNITLTLPTPFDIKSCTHKIRNEENDSEFAREIDSKIPEGKAFSFIKVKPADSEYVFSYPSHIGIKAKIPTNYGENVAYAYHYNFGFQPIECKTENGFVEVSVPQGNAYYIGVAVAGIEGTEIPEPTEPTSPAPTEPAESLPTTPATSDSVPTEPVEDTKPSTTSPVATDPTENTESTKVTDTTDLTEATSPTENTTGAKDEPTVPDTTTPDESDYLLGDVNRDGKVNIRDATLIQKYLAKMESLDDEQMIIADITLDKKVNIKDATYIQKKIAKLV